MTKAEMRREMAELKQVIRGTWIANDRGRTDTSIQKYQRDRLTDRWYELRRQLRAS
jgi:hypothetical protein